MKAPRKNEAVVSLGMAILCGLLLLATGNAVVASLAERGLSRAEKAGDRACATLPRTAGYGGPGCPAPVQLHPMRFR